MTYRYVAAYLFLRMSIALENVSKLGNKNDAE
jgi:hypothetical protein